MVDVASIIVAVISLVGALVAAGFTAWFTYFSDERKRLSESEKLIAKYRDPLLLACQDLQSRLYNITDQGFSIFFRVGGEQNPICRPPFPSHPPRYCSASSLKKKKPTSH